jgi:hypothetical protein
VAITWGAWEYSGGNGMRLGYEYAWRAVTSTSTQATIDLEIYTEVQFNYSGDTQTITYSGDASGTTNYTNNQSSGTTAYRGVLTYNYAYPTGSYNTSPGSKSYGGTLSGAYNGVTPSFSTGSIAIPARPGGIAKVWNGSAWVTGTAKVWNGSAWVVGQVRVWDGNSWEYGV